MTDGGPQFRDEFNTWCNTNYIEHILSSPANPQSNGLAESAVKNMKHLLIKLDSYQAFQTALIHWRNMPRENDDLSPAELFFGRKLRSNLPTLSLDAPLSPAISVKDSKLPALNVGDTVRIQNYISKKWDKLALVIAIRPTMRSYSVMNLENNRIYLRNRRFLKLVSSKSSASKEEEDSSKYPSWSKDTSATKPKIKQLVKAPERMQTRSMKKKDIAFNKHIEYFGP
jgi:hypothetical protein